MHRVINEFHLQLVGAPVHGYYLTLYKYIEAQVPPPSLLSDLFNPPLTLSYPHTCTPRKMEGDTCYGPLINQMISIKTQKEKKSKLVDSQIELSYPAPERKTATIIQSIHSRLTHFFKGCSVPLINTVKRASSRLSE